MTAADFLPTGRLSLPRLREAAAVCRGCDLYKNATQTDFGKGPARASVLFVGEQPGDQEDRKGDPFVGPAGRILAKAVEAAEIKRDEVYITNVVKHFKWKAIGGAGTGRGTRRLHARPSAREVKACRPWLESELAVVKPQVRLPGSLRRSGPPRVVVPAHPAQAKVLRRERLGPLRPRYQASLRHPRHAGRCGPAQRDGGSHLQLVAARMHRP